MRMEVRWTLPVLASILILGILGTVDDAFGAASAEVNGNILSFIISETFYGNSISILFEGSDPRGGPWSTISNVFWNPATNQYEGSILLQCYPIFLNSLGVFDNEIVTISNIPQHHTHPVFTTTVNVGEQGCENDPPVADAEVIVDPNQPNPVVGDTITLDGSGSNDPDDDPLTYRWTLTSPDGSTAELDDTASVSPEFDADFAGQYDVELIVNDGTVDSPPDTVSIFVGCPDPITVQSILIPSAFADGCNESPVAHITIVGDIHKKIVGEPIIANAFGTSFPKGEKVVEFRWTLIDPNGERTLLDNLFTTSFTPEETGSYLLELVVVTSNGEDDDLIQVQVKQGIDLTLTKLNDPRIRVQGDIVVSRALLTNNGAIAINEFSLLVNNFEDFSLVDVFTENGQCHAGRFSDYVCPLIDLAPGASISLTVVGAAGTNTEPFTAGAIVDITFDANSFVDTNPLDNSVVFKTLFLVGTSGDNDGDGLDNRVDLKPNEISFTFARGDSLLGEVIDAGGNTVRISPGSDQDSIWILVIQPFEQPPEEFSPLVIQWDGDGNPETNDPVRAEFSEGLKRVSGGSLIFEVTTGQILIEYILPDSTIVSTVINEGESLKLDTQPFEIVNLGTKPAKVLIDGMTFVIKPGGSLLIDDGKIIIDKPSTKVELCHKGKKTILISENAVPAHLEHDDTLGPCP